MARSRRTATWLGLVVGASLVAAPPTQAAPVAPFCDDVAVSPAFATDGSMFCVGRDLPRPDVGPLGVAFFRSRDRGRTWTRATAAGLTFTAGSTWRQVVVSPGYARDRAVFVQDNSQGLFVTRDGGETFALVDPLVRFDDAQPSLSPGAAPALAVDLPGPLLYAAHGTPTLVRPPVHTLVPGVPPTVTLRAFLATAGTTAAPRTYALATNKNASNLAADHTLELYACDANYACATRLASFPKGMDLAEAHLVAGFGTKPMIFVSLYRALGATGDPVQVWVSSDGGGRFERARSVERLLGPVRTAGPAAPRAYVDTLDGNRLYALVDTSAGPREIRALYYSGDGGRTWAARAVASRAGAQPLPVASGYSYLYSSRLWLFPNGALGVVGMPRDSGVGNAFACSVDGGRRWRPHC